MNVIDFIQINLAALIMSNLEGSEQLITYLLFPIEIRYRSVYNADNHHRITTAQQRPSQCKHRVY